MSERNLGEGQSPQCRTLSRLNKAGTMKEQRLGDDKLEACHLYRIPSLLSKNEQLISAQNGSVFGIQNRHTNTHISPGQ